MDCIVCNENVWKRVFDVRDVNQGVPGSWSIMVCNHCGLGVIDPLPKHDEIKSYYQENFYSPDAKRFNPFIERIRAFVSNFRGRKIRQMFSEGGRLLDFGAGSGHFGSTMIAAGWDVASVDLATNQTEDYIFSEEKICLNFYDSSFDVVTLWYVIEHINKPITVIRELKRVLKPGGLLVLSQQNFSSLQARLFRQNWLILDPPRHIYQFSPNNLIEFLRLEGFKLIEVKHSSFEMGPFTILQSILNSILGNKNYLFCYLKNKSITRKIKLKLSEKIMTILSCIFGIILLPISILIYYLLLLVKSGDVFTLYLRNE